ncbi:MAG: serine/threonine protein kinase [Rhodobacteraceae bacterium]|nr:serine/threonine protein kinase [Paracoccaceae bacterium]
MTLQAKIEPKQADAAAPVPANADALPPQTPLCNGQYVIDDFLNSGGFGMTYKARDSLGRQVVVKECFPGVLCQRHGLDVRLRAPQYNNDFDYIVGLFKREAQALAKLRHPGVVSVHQIFEENGTAYMALDFIAGPDLFEVIENHPHYLTPEVVQALAEQILLALDYVHENGILHRDISPDNILLDPNKTPVLIDFGASRVGQSRSSRVLSRVFTVKDGYSPQEFYFEGRFQSPASDLYALGATLYHLVTGSCPPNSSERLAAVAAKQPDPYEPLGSRYSAYPKAFTAMIDACMAPFAKDRIQSASQCLVKIGAKKPETGATPQGSALPAAMEPRTRADNETRKQISRLVESSLLQPEAEPAPEVEPTMSEEDRRRAERKAKEIEYWAILNEDPDELRRAVEEETAAEEQEEAAPEEPKRRSSLSMLLPWRKKKHAAGEEVSRQH